MGDLPPGFHFFPTDEELVVHFLCSKASLLPCNPDIIPSLDLRRYDPWKLDGKAFSAGGSQWYFFTRRGHSKMSPSGYWKAAGSVDEPVMASSSMTAVGLKRLLKFYLGEAPEGIKTNWMMHEYHLLDRSSGTTTTTSSSKSSRKRGQTTLQETNAWVLCRVFEMSCGSKPRFYDDGTELSCLDEVFLSLDDDLDEISPPN